jgi:hypothetical protein
MHGPKTLSMFLLYLVAVLTLWKRTTCCAGEPHDDASTALIDVDEILLSTSRNMTIVSCFLMTNHDIVNDASKNKAGRQACCRRIPAVFRKVESMFDDVFVSMDRCILELADVPTVSSLNDGDESTLAAFAWMIPISPSSTTKIQQYLYQSRNDNLLRSIRTTTSPFHHPKAEQSGRLRLAPSSIESSLHQDGGMHRLFQHSFKLLPGISSYFIFLIVPSGMFIDLDDPLEVDTRLGWEMQIMKVPVNGAKRSFELSWSHPQSTTGVAPATRVSFQVQLHASHICDIEQPSFVSQQHILVWELFPISSQNDTVSLSSSKLFPSSVLEFATKLHLRYPSPSSTMVDYIDLPQPLLLYKKGQLMDQPPEQQGGQMESDSSKEDDSPTGETQWQFGILERVKVAAGNDGDHDCVMGITMVSCLMGVALMLRDISRVSWWDDA